MVEQTNLIDYYSNTLAKIKPRWFINRVFINTARKFQRNANKFAEFRKKSRERRKNNALCSTANNLIIRENRHLPGQLVDPTRISIGTT